MCRHACVCASTYVHAYTTGGSAAGALSLAAATTREALRYHYDIEAPTIEDEALETALLAGRSGACSALPHTLPPAPQPSVYEPIFRCVCVCLCAGIEKFACVEVSVVQMCVGSVLHRVCCIERLSKCVH